jgi:hypothetical protein
MALSNKLFYIEQQDGDMAGFITGEGLLLMDGTFMVVRYAPEPGYRPVQTKAHLSFRDLQYLLVAGEVIVWYGGNLDPVQDMIRRQLERAKK